MVQNQVVRSSLEAKGRSQTGRLLLVHKRRGLHFVAMAREGDVDGVVGVVLMLVAELVVMVVVVAVIMMVESVGVLNGRHTGDGDIFTLATVVNAGSEG